MTIEDPNVVDLIGCHKVEALVALTISDHLDWADEQGHLELLQAKINRYLEFIESGELVESYPKAAGRAPVIEVVGAHPLPPRGIQFFEDARAALRDAGVDVDLRFSMLPEATN